MIPLCIGGCWVKTCSNESGQQLSLQLSSVPLYPSPTLHTQRDSKQWASLGWWICYCRTCEIYLIKLPVSVFSVAYGDRWNCTPSNLLQVRLFSALFSVEESSFQLISTFKGHFFLASKLTLRSWPHFSKVNYFPVSGLAKAGAVLRTLRMCRFTIGLLLWWTKYPFVGTANSMQITHLGFGVKLASGPWNVTFFFNLILILTYILRFLKYREVECRISTFSCYLLY